MATLLIDAPGWKLQLEQRTLRVSDPEGAWRRVPLALLDRVVIEAPTTLSTPLLAALARESIPVLIVEARQGEVTAASIGGRWSDASRRLAQYRLAQDPDWRARWASRLLAAKFHSQARVLARAARRRREIAPRLEPARAELERFRADLLRAPQEPAALLGKEGAAARTYFQALTRLFPASLEFTGRNRRPPRDPVNACLSLGYTLVHYQIAALLAAAGLDPYIGFFHEPAPGRESLAADLTELERARVDEFVCELFRTRTLRPENFSHRKNGACLLGRAGRRRFYEAFESFAARLVRRQRRLCRTIVRLVETAAHD